MTVMVTCRHVPEQNMHVMLLFSGGLLSHLVCPQITAPTLEQTDFTVNEGDGSVEVCMHFGGEGLNITATVTTSGTATSRPEMVFGTYVVLQYMQILQYGIIE